MSPRLGVREWSHTSILSKISIRRELRSVGCSSHLTSYERGVEAVNTPEFTGNKFNFSEKEFGLMVRTNGVDENVVVVI